MERAIGDTPFSYDLDSIHALHGLVFKIDNWPIKFTAREIKDEIGRMPNNRRTLDDWARHKVVMAKMWKSIQESKKNMVARANQAEQRMWKKEEI